MEVGTTFALFRSEERHVLEFSGALGLVDLALGVALVFMRSAGLLPQLQLFLALLFLRIRVLLLELVFCCLFGDWTPQAAV